MMGAVRWDVMLWDVPDVYAVRGHVSADRFVDAVRGYLQVDDYAPMPLAGDVAHGWFRFVPSTQAEEFGAYHESAPGRGAFTATVGTLDRCIETYRSY
jgi:hypothetical protein